jgi:ATP synthase protein I
MKNRSPYIVFGIYASVGIQLAAAVVAGLLIGDYIDSKLGTSPWLALIGLVLGATGGMWNLIRVLRWSQRGKGES